MVLQTSGRGFDPLCAHHPAGGGTHVELSALLRPLLAAYRPASREEWEATVRALWDVASHREERYAALALAKHRSARGWLDAAVLPLVHHLVVTGAWWDYVDDVAANLVGPALVADRERATPLLRAWASDEDPWVRRTVVLCQLKSRRDTDLELLRHAVECNVDDPSFWLRKAIGWALREYARLDPEWVRAEVARLDGRISGLSRREALKRLA
ncbi:DNA alkylation repair protein [Nocardioides panaciterrulae]|uniref:DNA alkylation repair protein n=1 Tax=Nocardioides panaciterrulae TaxID=661492 RepID=UPI0015C7A8A2|nr:DNA alkylation repair protein [Nocardioides panaciterrulae]